MANTQSSGFLYGVILYQVQQFFDHEVVQRHSLLVCLRFHLTGNHLDNRPSDTHLFSKKIDVAPLQPDELTTTQAAAAIQQHHGAFSLPESSEQALKLFDFQHHRDALPLSTLPNVLHGIGCFNSRKEFMAHPVAKNRAHDVADLHFGTTCSVVFPCSCRYHSITLSNHSSTATDLMSLGRCWPPAWNNPLAQVTFVTFLSDHPFLSWLSIRISRSR